MNKDEEFNILLGQWMREKREKAGFTQKEIGEHLGVSKPMVSFYESGRYTISAKSFVRFCKLVGADPDEIVKLL